MVHAGLLLFCEFLDFLCGVLSPERMAAIAALGPTVVSDEIYHGLNYEGRDRSMLEFTDRAFVLNGFSKAFAMTIVVLVKLKGPE